MTPWSRAQARLESTLSLKVRPPVTVENRRAAQLTMGVEKPTCSFEVDQHMVVSNVTALCQITLASSMGFLTWALLTLGLWVLPWALQGLDQYPCSLPPDARSSHSPVVTSIDVLRHHLVSPTENHWPKVEALLHTALLINQTLSVLGGLNSASYRIPVHTFGSWTGQASLRKPNLGLIILVVTSRVPLPTPGPSYVPHHNPPDML